MGSDWKQFFEFKAISKYYTFFVPGLGKSKIMNSIFQKNKYSNNEIIIVSPPILSFYGKFSHISPIYFCSVSAALYSSNYLGDKERPFSLCPWDTLFLVWDDHYMHSNFLYHLFPISLVDAVLFFNLNSVSKLYVCVCVCVD